MSDADYCRSKGWGVGTRLIGTEGGEDWSSTTTIELTAIGERLIVAKAVAQVSRRRAGWFDPWEEVPTMRSLGEEGLWTLSCRDWEEVPHG